VLAYYQLLVQFLDRAVQERFVLAEHRALIQIADDPAALLARLEPFPTVQLRKWLDRAER
jgi:predicted Rossmann-fold nucleotide-binding protein